MHAHLDAYLRSQRRVAALLAGCGDAADVVVGACAPWTVADLVAHLAGVADDLVARRVDGWATPTWTAAHVERAARAVDALLARWTAVAGAATRVAAALGSDGRLPSPAPVMLMFDALAHEQDLRTALGEPSVDDTAALDLALSAALAALRREHLHAGLPGVVVESTDGRRWTVGDDADALVRGDAFELWRALAGRRTRDEVCGLEWDGDPAPHLTAWMSPVFAWPSASIGESRLREGGAPAT